MTKTTRARPDSPLPDADLSVNHMNQIHECLPQSLRHEILKTAVDAKALAWLLLEVVDNRRRQRDALQELLWRETSTVDNGGDLSTRWLPIPA